MTGKKPPPRKNVRAKSKDDFRSEFDKNFICPKKIQAALDEIGKEGWEYEREFLVRAGLSTTDLARFRDQFEEYHVGTGGRNPKRVWAGSIEFAQELRDMAT